MLEELKSILKEAIETVLAEHDLEIMEFDISHRNKNIAVRIIADGIEQPITIDQCSLINKLVAQKIEDDDLIHSEYVVEVSSPGLDRPLKTKRDFEKVTGKEVRFHLSEKIANKIEHIGTVKLAMDEEVVITVKSEEITIPLDCINKAVQVI